MRICRDTAILDIALLVNAEYQRVQQHSAASIGGWDRPGFEFETCLAHSVCTCERCWFVCIMCFSLFLSNFLSFNAATTTCMSCLSYQYDDMALQYLLCFTRTTYGNNTQQFTSINSISVS